MVDRIRSTDAQGNPASEPVVRTGGHHAPNEAAPDNFARPPMPGDRVAAPASGEAAPVAEETAVEPTIRVRAHTEFWNDGVLRRVGDEFDMPVSRAQIAGLYIKGIVNGEEMSSAEAVRRTVPQTSVRRADLAGRPRHERIEELTNEEAALSQRLDQVRAQLAKEREVAQPTPDAAPVATEGAVTK